MKRDRKIFQEYQGPKPIINSPNDNVTKIPISAAKRKAGKLAQR